MDDTLLDSSPKDTAITTTADTLEHTPPVGVRPPTAVPGQVHRHLDSAGLNHRPVLLAIDSDVDLAGDPVREWLVVTPDHLAVTDGERTLRAVAWPVVERVRTSAGVGGGSLQVRAEGTWVDLIRYSNALAARFHKVSRALDRSRERLATAPHLGLEGLDGPLDPPACPACGLRLQTAEDSCPRCLQKGQILKRVGTLLAPYARGSIVLCLLTFVGVVAELVPPKLQQTMVDDILSARSGGTDGTLPDFKTALLVVVLALAFSRVLLAVVGVVKGRLTTAIGSGITSALREEMVR